MDPRFTQKTVKFGGRKIMVWGYIQYGGVREICRVEGNINSLKYQEVLAASYIPNHKRGQILQQDGAPSHTSISTSKFLKAKKIKVLQDWPAQSPDMNIIEHVWGRMKEEARKTKPKNLDELWEACKTAFFAIPDDFINKLYESLPNRMDAVLQAHGSHTRYYIWISQHHYLIRWCYATYFCNWSKLLVQFSHYFLKATKLLSCQNLTFLSSLNEKSFFSEANLF